MNEKPWKRIYLTLMVLTALLLSVTLFASRVLADDTGMPSGPPPGPPPSVQSLAQGDYLYVLEMRSIHQFYLSDLSLKQTVALPDLPAPPTEVMAGGPPPMPPRCSFLGQGELLFVFEMRSIHKYKLPSLELVTTTTLPTPELPQ